MRNRLLATTFFSMSLALSGIAFAQTQNSTDAGKHEDPDAASDVREAAPPAIAPSAGMSDRTTTSTTVRVAPGAPPQQAIAPGGSQHSTEDGKRNDPDAATDVKEGETPK